MSAYYKYTLSALRQKLKISGHMFIRTFFPDLVCGTFAQNLFALSVTPYTYTAYTCARAHKHTLTYVQESNVIMK
jgi:hypothetical protein